MDQRICDLPFSELFFKYVIGNKPEFSDLKIINPSIATFLNEFIQIVKRKERGEKNILYRGVEIKDLYLNFTLPGFPEIELIENGKNKIVKLYNLNKYINLVVNYYLNIGIAKQIKHFIHGFNKIFQIVNLRVFSFKEFNQLINGQTEKWNQKLLSSQMLFKHGYTYKSRTVLNLIQVLCEFTEEEQNLFIRFVTGSPRLPVGGISNLNPKLTIVKSVHLSTIPDMILPTAMTCHHYFVLPDYSSKKILKERLKPQL